MKIQSKHVMNLFAKWRRLTWQEKALFSEALFFLGLARLAVCVMPFKWLAIFLGKQEMRGEERSIAASSLCLARKIGKAVCTAANHTPWDSVCLPQAIAGLWMLKRRGIAGTLFLGVAKNMSKPDTLAAHAWLICGGLILTGANEMNNYTAVASFS